MNVPSRRLGPHEFFRYVEERAAMFAGLADSTLSRDDGYRFLLLGRSIERVDMIVRMLLARAGDRPSSPAWVSVLRSAGAHDTYLRTYRGALDANRVVEFILLDRLFPRSVFHSIRQAEKCLQELDPQPGSRVGIRAEGAEASGPRTQRTRVPAAGRVARGSAGTGCSVGRRPAANWVRQLHCSTSTLRRGSRGRMPAPRMR